MHKLSAPTDDEFLRDLDRYSVPFALVVDGYELPVPPCEWERVFNGPHDEARRPKNRGGLTAATVLALKQKRIKSQPNDALRRTADAAEARQGPRTSHSMPNNLATAETSPDANHTPTAAVREVKPC
jgi:hypothetical protein